VVNITDACVYMPETDWASTPSDQDFARPESRLAIDRAATVDRSRGARMPP
jgi:hypothetical protein